MKKTIHAPADSKADGHHGEVLHMSQLNLSPDHFLGHYTLLGSESQDLALCTMMRSTEVA